MLFIYPIFLNINICPPSFHSPSIYKLPPAYTRLLHTLLRLLSFLCESAISSWKIFQYFPHKYYLWSFHHGTGIALVSMIAAISVVDGPVCKNSADDSCLFWAFGPWSWDISCCSEYRAGITYLHLTCLPPLHLLYSSHPIPPVFLFFLILWTGNDLPN